MDETDKKAGEEDAARAARESIPFELRAIGPEEVAGLLGCQPRSVLEVYACRPGFPERIQKKPARWIAGEVLEWRKERMRRAA